MTATLTTAAMLLAPFLAVVLVGALAVAIHDAVERAWTAARASGAAEAPKATRRRLAAARGGRRSGGADQALRPASAARQPVRRAPVVAAR